MHLVGLTGGIATGKTFVLSILTQLGCASLRADDLARDILFPRPQTELLPALQELLGPEGFLPDGQLSRDHLRQKLFEQESLRLALNRLVHPRVETLRQERVRDLEKEGLHQLLVYESALLVEAGLCPRFERIIVTYTREDVRLERLLSRDGISQAQAEQRIRAQFPLSEKLKAAHYSIDTSGSPEQTRQQTLEVFHLLCRDLKLKPPQE